MRSRWPLVAAVTLIGVPLVLGALLFFGGGQVQACLGGTACGLEPPARTLGLSRSDLIGVSVMALGVGWLALAALVARDVARRDRRRLRMALAAVVLVVGVTGVVVAALGFMGGLP